jgi:protoporphyrinogen oxidase
MGADAMKVGIIGGGAAGLAAGYALSQRGVEVEVFERDQVLGGLAGSFMLEGGYVEKFYHFICLHDHTYLETLRELKLDHRLRWRLTDMGQFYNGKLYSFGRPYDLFFFPYIPFRDKIRFARNIMKIKSAKWDDWRKIENDPVDDWLLSTFGENVYRLLHEPMIRLKFGNYKKRLSAAWMWARIHRLGKSRTKIRQREKVGYVEGGSQMIMDALGSEIEKRGGKIVLQSQVEELLMANDSVTGMVINGQPHYFDAVLSTVPLPAFLRLIPESLNGEYWQRLRNIESIGVVCVFLRTSKSLTRYFWTNINDPRIELAGAIEYTNLNPLPHLGGDSILYLPQYLPSTSAKFSKPNEEIIREYVGYLKLLNPSFSEDQVKMALVFREKYAQPICEVGFTKDIPNMRTPLRGLYLTDSSQLHPDDRTISNSLGLGKSAASLIVADADLQSQRAIPEYAGKQ